MVQEVNQEICLTVLFQAIVFLIVFCSPANYLPKLCEDMKPVYQVILNYMEKQFHCCQSCLIIILELHQLHFLWQISIYEHGDLKTLPLHCDIASFYINTKKICRITLQCFYSSLREIQDIFSLTTLSSSDKKVGWLPEILDQSSNTGKKRKVLIVFEDIRRFNRFGTICAIQKTGKGPMKVCDFYLQLC